LQGKPGCPARSPKLLPEIHKRLAIVRPVQAVRINAVSHIVQQTRLLAACRPSHHAIDPGARRLVHIPRAVNSPRFLDFATSPPEAQAPVPKIAARDANVIPEGICFTGRRQPGRPYCHNAIWCPLQIDCLRNPLCRSGVRESNPPHLLGRQRPKATRPTPRQSRALCVALRLPVSMRRIVACAGLWAGVFGWSESGTLALITCLPPALRRRQGQSELDGVDFG
jgi:hypothetical protein